MTNTVSKPVPQNMRAAAIDHYGGPEALSVRLLPTPSPGDHEVLIALDTAGVGVWDAEMRAGWSPGGGPVQFPLVLGTDGSGTVVAVGSKVRRLKPGDLVYAYSFNNAKGGFYAEYVAVLEEAVAHIPKSLDPLRAGAIPTTGLTALQGIDDALRLQRDESILIHGASGGVGTLAIQFAKLRGARVLATASGEDGLELVRDLGADSAVDGRGDDLTAAARSFAPAGIDALLGLTGNALVLCVEALRSGGRVAYPNGVEPVPDPGKRPDVTMIPYDAIAGPTQFERLGQAVEAAKLQVPIDQAYPLGEAAEAHRRLAAGHVLGKIVLRIS